MEYAPLHGDTMKAGRVVQTGMVAAFVVTGLVMMPGRTGQGMLPRDLSERACTRSAHTTQEIRWDMGRNFACLYLPDSRQFAWKAIGPHNPTPPPAPVIPPWDAVVFPGLDPSV